MPQGQNPFEGGANASSQKFVNPDVESYNDVGLNHLTTLDSQIKGDKDKPSQ